MTSNLERVLFRLGTRRNREGPSESLGSLKTFLKSRDGALVCAHVSRYLQLMPRTAPSKRVVTVDPFDPIRSERRMLDVFMKAADTFDAKHSKSKETARKQLQKEGIITSSGKLTRHYGS